MYTIWDRKMATTNHVVEKYEHYKQKEQAHGQSRPLITLNQPSNQPLYGLQILVEKQQKSNEKLDKKSNGEQGELEGKRHKKH